MNKWLGIGVLGLLSAGAFKLFHLKQFSDKLMINLSNPRIHKIDSKGLAFRTEILLQNPTKYQLTITKPYITITTNGKFVSGSTPEQKVFKIAELATTKIDTVEIIISWSVIAGYASDIIFKIPAILAAFKTKDMKAVAKAIAIPLEMQYSLYADGFFYECEPQKIL